MRNSIIVAVVVVAITTITATVARANVYLPLVLTAGREAFAHAYIEPFGYAMFVGQRLEIHCEGDLLIVQQTHDARVVVECK